MASSGMEYFFSYNSHLLRDNPPCRGDACTRERSHSTRKHTPFRSLAANICWRRVEPGKPLRGKDSGRLGHLPLTRRFPLVRCLFFPPMVAV